MRFAGRRYQGTATHSEGVAEQSAFSKFWNSTVGPKTVHFWAPVMKVHSPPPPPRHVLNLVDTIQWGLVLTGASDFARPASSLSLTQNVALTCTGAIWTRWCFIIKPRNIFLASVNFLLFLVGATQVTRVVRYQQEVKGISLSEELKEKAQDAGAKVEEMAKDPSKIKDAVAGK